MIGGAIYCKIFNKECLRTLFSNVQQGVSKCYNKTIILKVINSKHVKISSLYLVINPFFLNVLILYPLKTSFFCCFQEIQNENMREEIG